MPPAPDLTIQRLAVANPLRQPVLRSAIQALCLPPASRGLDLGCGIGLQALSLAEEIGQQGRVIGLDIDPQLLGFGAELASQAGLTQRVGFLAGDMHRLPFEDNSLDWMWSCDCVGYPSADQAPLLAELIRVLKPGGKLAILAWSSQQVLPGHPLLEARLNATCSSYLPYLKGVSRDRHFFRAPHWFRQAGLVAVKAYTFVGTVEAPFKAGERAALASLFEMLWGQSQPEAADEDWREYQRLCLPGSGDFILNLPDYYAFFTYSMFEGEKALAGA